jgi:uncharacterized protein (DUF362 family)
MVRVSEAGGLEAAVRQALSWLDWRRLIPGGACVFVKPNLTWREPTAGVTSTLPFIESVVLALRTRAGRVLVAEADGGYHAFSEDEAFRSHSIDRLTGAGVDVVNLSREPVESRTVLVGGRSATVTLPRVLLHEVDVFVTLPVHKVHAMTDVCLDFKNQWGCQPGTMPLRNRPDFVQRFWRWTAC